MYIFFKSMSLVYENWMEDLPCLVFKQGDNLDIGEKNSIITITMYESAS
jgi:hypothetical protein